MSQSCLLFRLSLGNLIDAVSEVAKIAMQPLQRKGQSENAARGVEVERPRDACLTQFVERVGEGEIDCGEVLARDGRAIVQSSCAVTDECGFGAKQVRGRRRKI